MPYDPNDQQGAPAPQQQPGTNYGWQSTDYGRARYDQVNSAYQQYMGRTAGADEIWGSHLNWDRAPDANFMSKILGNIQNSDEAKAYASRPATTTNAPAPTAAPAPKAPPSTGSPVTDTGKIPPAQPVAQATTQAATNPAPQYQAPNQSETAGLQSALLKAILGSPETMNANVVAQMKEAQKQQALLMGQQNQSQLDNAGVARGTLGAGAHASMTGQNLQDTMGTVLDSNRAIDIQAASQNRQDQLNALTAGSSVMGATAQRAQSDYTTGLQGWLAQNNNLGDWAKFYENQRQFNGQLGFNYNSLDQQGQLSFLQWMQNMGLA